MTRKYIKNPLVIKRSKYEKSSCRLIFLNLKGLKFEFATYWKAFKKIDRTDIPKKYRIFELFLLLNKWYELHPLGKEFTKSNPVFKKIEIFIQYSKHNDFVTYIQSNDFENLTFDELSTIRVLYNE